MASTLELQLHSLSSTPNHFQAHALAALRLLERRRRRGGQRQCQKPVTIPPTPAPLISPKEGDAPNGHLLTINEEGKIPRWNRHITAPPDCLAVGPELIKEKSPSSNDASSQIKEELASNKAATYPALLRRELKVSMLMHNAPSLPSIYTQGRLSNWPSNIVKMLQKTASLVAKNLEQSGWRLYCGSSQIPHPRKIEKGGEDSLFVCPDGSAVGVADGVGEWEWRFGLNPRAFADELMLGARIAGQQSLGNPFLEANERAAWMLSEGYNSTGAFGSSTALIAALHPKGRSELGVANLGDSGLRILRRQENGSVTLIHRTVEQQHCFNCPYQLARLPVAKDFDRLTAQGFSSLVRAVQATPNSKQDFPHHADTYNFPVQEGDLLLLGTDGVFDNLHDHEVCELAELAVFPGKEHWISASDRNTACDPTEPSCLATAFAQAARLRSEDQGAKTPFSLSAKEARLQHVGGKLDDISVVAGWVMRG